MNSETMARVEAWFLGPHRSGFAQLDEALRGRRGPRLVPVSVLLGGVVYLIGERRRVRVTELARCLRHEATDQDLRCLWGAPARDGAPGCPAAVRCPSRWQLYRLLAALRRALAVGADPRDRRVVAVRALLGESDPRALLTTMNSWLLEGTVPDDPPDGVWAADTTYLDAYTRPISGERIKTGERASDPDARWRRIDRPDAPPKLTFGYQMVAVTATNPHREYVRAVATAPADEYDAPMAVDLVHRLQQRAIPITTLIVDRGFSQSQAFLEQIRDRGVAPVFDLRSDQDRRSPDWKGCLVLDGWPYLPSLPRRLRSLPRPAPNAPKEEKDAWRVAAAEREKYALAVKEWVSSKAVRVQSPVFRNRGVGCQRMPHTVRHANPALAVCRGVHGPDEACGIRNATWRATVAPWTYQCPAWGSRNWEEAYNRRSSIERRFSLFKNADSVGVSAGQIRWRGLPAVTLLCALGWVAHNLQLRALDEAEAVQGRPRAPTRVRGA